MTQLTIKKNETMKPPFCFDVVYGDAFCYCMTANQVRETVEAVLSGADTVPHVMTAQQWEYLSEKMKG